MRVSHYHLHRLVKSVRCQAAAMPLPLNACVNSAMGSIRNHSRLPHDWKLRSADGHTCHFIGYSIMSR